MNGFLAASLSACILLGTGVAAPALAVPRITSEQVHRDVTDFGPRGIDIGRDGYWFANFDAPEPNRGAPDRHHANALPGWMLVDFEPVSDPESPPYSFSLTPGPDGPDATSVGGNSDCNQFTLPDGRTGRSGQLVDVNVGPKGNSTLIKTWEFGDGAPHVALVHIVLDNAPLAAGRAVDRLRVTHTNAEGGIKDRAAFEDLTASNNGIADVYTFRLEGIEVGGSIAVQLAAAADGSTTDTALAGVLLDAVEFPPSQVRFELRWLWIPLVVGVFAGGFALGRWTRRQRQDGLET